MKRFILIIAALTLFVGAAFAQTLSDNSYYAESLRLKDLASQAFEDGDYDAAADYAAQSQEYALLSDEYVAKMLDLKSAQDAVMAAQARYDWAAGINAEKRYPVAFANAGDALEKAVLALDGEAYEDARMNANLVLAHLSTLKEAVSLPAQYVVRDIPGKEDCLWRIAGLSGIYSNPWRWTTLYKANRAKLPEPNNPDLILPGMILDIPAIDGEYREGFWEEGVEYPAFAK
jgi:nucleoid-associated protein YgaU